MRAKFSEAVEAGRDRATEFATPAGARYGKFKLRSGTGTELTVIISDGADWQACGLPGRPWEHVSVSLPHRCPNWEEMCWVKDQFFDPEEAVVQFHPPRSKYVNNHPNCLHLWRPLGRRLRLPPPRCV